ncbi:MAG TPA: hypothetical protein PLZ93_09675 [Nocardioides sp.]|uniref:DUF6941 family protein n=1 Tax=uncultured Nocardioides sp. TaxID=198441 RepID=UPI000EC8FB7F|nr:hypothetical protein [uncultured Nocardioides sp.]HCB06110.1 hypothetical protein [Nocardioides sp.]HRD62735.1 hypothetical protein [Nocardioides sp.]HRI95870.1 hypothetical protein [Nocardioides sp.]HRK45737.1 hypothetical protein [Nocardioides sp.]
MAELDYAFIADFAKVEPNGTLTAVGASWTFLNAREFPSAHRMAVAGRVRGSVDEEPVTLRIDVRGPNDTFRLATDSQLSPQVSARPYGDGRVGLLFALDLQVPLTSVGLYEIYISVNGVEARRLAFEAAVAETA